MAVLALVPAALVAPLAAEARPVRAPAPESAPEVAAQESAAVPEREVELVAESVPPAVLWAAPELVVVVRLRTAALQELP